MSQTKEKTHLFGTKLIPTSSIKEKNNQLLFAINLSSLKDQAALDSRVKTLLAHPHRSRKGNLTSCGKFKPILGKHSYTGSQETETHYISIQKYLRAKISDAPLFMVRFCIIQAWPHMDLLLVYLFRKFSIMTPLGLVHIMLGLSVTYTLEKRLHCTSGNMDN